MQTTRPDGRWWCKAAATAVFVSALVGGCDNSPYDESDEDTSSVYLPILEEPRSLDPGGEDWSCLRYLANIVEPPFEYEYLEPTKLKGLTAVDVPKPEPRKVTYKGKEYDAVAYRIRLKRGIMYHEHPCFVEANRHLTADQAARIDTMADFTSKAARELTAADYVHTFRRLADSRTRCVVYATLAKSLLGMKDYRKMVEAKVTVERAKRRKAVGDVRYNQEWDNKYNPIVIDYADGAEAFPFVKLIDSHTFEIVLSSPYPPILYWLAMPFFGPVPAEQVAFHAQPVLLARGVFLNRNPLGTGPYTLGRYDPINEIVLNRNLKYRPETYPTLSPDHPDYARLEAAGLLEDAGKSIPTIDRIVYRMEKETVPRWSKFRQGYYDEAAIEPDLFDQAANLSSAGSTTLSDEMVQRGVRMVSGPPQVLRWYTFNMEDPVVGGYTDKKRKLRQAISIALDVEEGIAVFANGQGVAAHGPVPPGLFGAEEGRAGMNPYVYDWDEDQQRPKRKSLKEAKRLLAEAGYREGVDAEGKPLTLKYITGTASAAARSKNTFVSKQLKRLGIELTIEISNSNVFHDKAMEGSFQLIGWGWAPDYPDPENYLFLFYTSPDNKDKDGKPIWGQNKGRYSNKEFEELFVKMRAMDNSPERLKIIRKMLDVIRRDAPAAFDYFPQIYGLYHQWYHCASPRVVSYNTLKFQRIDPVARKAYRREHNKPVWWPVALVALLIAVVLVPGIVIATRHLREV